MTRVVGHRGVGGGVDWGCSSSPPLDHDERRERDDTDEYQRPAIRESAPRSRRDTGRKQDRGCAAHNSQNQRT